jgi:IS30 family transposase
LAGVALALDEREEIRAGLERGESFASIGRALGRHRTTIAREVDRNGGRQGYRAAAAEQRATHCRRRPKMPKLLRDRRLGRVVTSELRAGYSPAGIAARLRNAGGATVSHETIYRAVYSHTFVGIGLRGQDCLRMRRRRRHHHGTPRPQRNGRNWATAKLIDARPIGATDRSEPGHWEGDLIIGAGQRSAVITLVERVSRLTLLADLPDRRRTKEVRAALVAAFDGIPPVMRASLTWDQGVEMAQWPTLESALEMSIYLCHPHSPWERPSNEHTNRQPRYWLPKGSDLSIHGPRQLRRIQTVLNTQPRRSLGWATPQHTYDHLVDALTD